MKPGRIIVAVAAVALIGYAAMRSRGVDEDDDARPSLPLTHAPTAEKIVRLVPEGTRVRVEVLNATKTRGLGRHATRYLRDRGFDVVDVGNAPSPRDSTLVIDRRGDGQWAKIVAQALGAARVESKPDSSRYLDVTVLLGASWRPPAQPFYP